jgi:hypothetical protein
VRKIAALKAECISFARCEANGSISEDSRFGDSSERFVTVRFTLIHKYVVILSEAKDLGVCWAPTGLRATTEIPRFARDDMEWG